jgi:hypothetical protein
MGRQKMGKKSVRKPYRKPQLEKVQLFVEEAVLQTCKVKGGLNNPECSPQAVDFCNKTSSKS